LTIPGIGDVTYQFVHYAAGRNVERYEVTVFET
jgi:hypothetical protein